MKREELTELHYIAPMTNIPSILEHGILSHNGARKVAHESVAMPEIQERRRRVRLPGGRLLHDYVNLYIHARNPMMYKRKDSHNKLCVLKISSAILDLPGAVVCDGNASSDYVRFAAAPKGLEIVETELAFAEWWTHPDFFEKCRRSVARCAEILVPDSVQPQFILGAYVSSEENQQVLSPAMYGIAVSVNSHLFFRIGGL